jgi:hypothetical protein
MYTINSVRNNNNYGGRGPANVFPFKTLLLQALCSSSFMYCLQAQKQASQTRVRHGIINHCHT